ncbi:TPR repeat protein-like protein [Elsinoe ampelina]|uniref:TPR repeat protein-like protein n=1 Tax=Elsinoe ampelina TaxID=302913 RepID=A0A6A6FXW1_9PEZI|nr:TPR repeat protein-like protein [Elsinoe ampelina]
MESLETIRDALDPNAKTGPSPTAGAGASIPPAMKDVKQYSADEVLEQMNKVPLFMTNLDDIGDGDNIQLEAIKALAYEGTRAEIAGNFREQGNEAAKQKLWKDAREFYDRAIQSLKMTDEQLQKAKGGEGPSDFEVLDVDEDEETRRQRQIMEASLVNRALCNLELKNYGSCNRDCAATLLMNPQNVKAWYRSATACLALDKLPEAEDACHRGLGVDLSNAALQTLANKIAKRKQYVQDQENARRKREERKRAEETALRTALVSRNIVARTTAKAPDMEDAVLSLEDPLDPKSILRFPVMLLYPVHAQSDFIKQFCENENLAAHLEYILPLPWDEESEYTFDNVDCYVATISGGLVKAGKNMALLKILSSGKVEVVDGLLQINVVPRSQAKAWIEKWKAQHNR